MLKNAGILTAALAAAVLSLAGCGGGDSGSSASGEQPAAPKSPGAIVTQSQGPGAPPQKPPAGSINRDKVLKYAKCMRDNGLKNFPDPDAAGAIQMNGDVVDLNSPEFKKAQQKCGSLMPAQGPTSIQTQGAGGS